MVVLNYILFQAHNKRKEVLNNRLNCNIRLGGVQSSLRIASHSLAHRAPCGHSRLFLSELTGFRDNT